MTQSIIFLPLTPSPKTLFSCNLICSVPLKSRLSRVRWGEARVNSTTSRVVKTKLPCKTRNSPQLFLSKIIADCLLVRIKQRKFNWSWFAGIPSRNNEQKVPKIKNKKPYSDKKRRLCNLKCFSGTCLQRGRYNIELKPTELVNCVWIKIKTNRKNFAG